MINSSVKVLIYWCALAIPFGIYTLMNKEIDFNLALLDTYTLPSAVARPIFLAILFGVSALLVVFVFLAKGAAQTQNEQ